MAYDFLTRFRVVNEEDKETAIQKLIKDSTPDFDFFFFVVLSVLMATLGLLVDSVAVVIGSMLVAPIMYPVLSLALGMSISDHVLVSRSLGTISKSIVLAIVASVAVTLLLTPGIEELTGGILARTEPSLLYFSIALIAGLAVSFALVRPELSSTLPGIAVSVALIPPLAVVGIGIARLSLEVVSGSFVLFAINIIGIVFASMVAFSLTNLHRNHEVVKEAIKAEKDRVAEEKWATRELHKEEERENGEAEDDNESSDDEHTNQNVGEQTDEQKQPPQ